MSVTKTLLTGLALLAVLSAGADAQDTAANNVRLTFQIVEADGFQEADPAITEIVDELRQLFRFEGYRLLDTSVLRGVADDDWNRVQQRLALKDYGTVEIEALIQATSAPGVARIAVTLRDATGEFYSDGRLRPGPAVMDVSVNVRNGQTVVLGSGRPNNAGGAIILVMTAEIEPNP